MRVWLYLYLVLRIKCVLCRTELDRSDTEDYRQREERAARLACEIEGSNGSQSHENTDRSTTEEEL